MVQRLEASQVPGDEDISIEPLGQQHDRAAFVCSKPHLTHYFTGDPAAKRTLDQDLKWSMARPFVMVHKRTNAVIGYFTLANQSISRELFSKKVRNSMGYPQVPTMLLGRMAIHESVAGHGLGKKLLLAALLMAHKLTDGGKGCYAVVLDAGDDSLVGWYAKYGQFTLTPTESQPRRMVLPMIKIIDEVAKGLA